jgi:transcriptional antiterminator RfaH
MTARQEDSGTTESPDQSEAAPGRAHWFVVHSKPRQERIARDNLERQGYRVALPEITVRKRRRGRWSEVEEPLFPSYLFVKLQLGQDNIAPIRSTFGVRKLVRMGQQYIPVPDAVMAVLLAGPKDANRHAPMLQPGDIVRFESGAFEGIRAVYQMPKGEDRAQVLLELMGRVSAVTVPTEEIAKIE